MGRDAFGDWRARRIRTLLAASDRHTVADFTRMQVDVESSFAQQVLPSLLSVPGLQGNDAKAQALLKDWDGSMTMAAPQPLIFNAWIDQFNDAVLHRAGIEPYQGGPVAEFVAYVLSPAGAHWCGGDCTALLQQALTTATKALGERFGDDPSAWRWGDAHRAIFAHPILRNIPVLGALTTISIPSPGDDTTVDRGGPDSRFESVHGAAYRGVYDLADLDSSRFVITPGQSGNPASRHARDFVTRWRDGATITLGPQPAATTATIRLEP
jgi:penicillin G amidase